MTATCQEKRCSPRNPLPGCSRALVNRSTVLGRDQQIHSHKSWGYRAFACPDVAVNEVRQDISQRFGLDSFETRSTA